jgi:hypothetical protein
MSVGLAPQRTTSVPSSAGWRVRRARRRSLERQDRLASRAAELYAIASLLRDAEAVLDAGWLQHDWFSVTDPSGREHRVNAWNLHLLDVGEVSAACLVGGIVHAAGGTTAVHTQLVGRTLDLTWHALREEPATPVRWCPSPGVRIAQLRDLTRWNDRPGRTVSEASGLLRSAVRLADTQRALVVAG